MSIAKTHRLIAKPKISARFLADFMDASELGSRKIIRDCKFRPIARVVQHDRAKTIVGAYLRGRVHDPEILVEKAQSLRDMIASDDFEREVLDHNVDYVQRFADVAPDLALPPAEISVAGPCPALAINGTTVTVDLCFRMRRTTRTNKIRVGAGTLRYAKRKALSPEIGAWQSSFLFGYLQHDAQQDNAEPEHKLCLTLDAYAGVAYAAPGDAIRRFKNMEGACASIAERWPNVAPPPNAVY